MKQKSSNIFSDWLNDKPAKLRPYIKAQLTTNPDGPQWSEATYFNKRTRTPLTISEQKLINVLFNEKIF